MEHLPRRQPIVVAPETGEAFSSWITRYSLRLATTPGLLVEALGLPLRPHAVDSHPRWADIWLTDTAARALEAATGWPRQAFAGSHLSSFDGTLVDLSALHPDDERTVRPVVGREWLLAGRSRACGGCLADTGGVWQTWWRLGLAAVCPTHRTVLADTCPACGLLLASGHRYPARFEAAPGWSCGATWRGGSCAHDLRTLPRVPAPAGAAEAQRRLLDAAGRSHSTSSRLMRRLPVMSREMMTIRPRVASCSGSSLGSGRPWIDVCPPAGVVAPVAPARTVGLQFLHLRRCVMALVNSYLSSPSEVIQGDGRPAAGALSLEFVDEAGSRLALSPRFASFVVELLAALDQGKVVHVDIDEPLVSAERAAELIGVTRPTIYAWQDRNLIARVDQGSRRMVPVSDIERFQRDQQERAAWRDQMRSALDGAPGEAEPGLPFQGLVDLTRDPESPSVRRRKRPRSAVTRG